MSSKVTQPWVPIEKIEVFVQAEPALVILGLAFSAWAASKALRHLSEDRRRNLKKQLKSLGFHLLFGGALFLSYMGLQHFAPEHSALERLSSYIGLITIFEGAAIFVKVSRILVFEYLFLSHMRVAFPVLLVNLFILLLSIILTVWIGAEIFNIRIAPILATSAIFSLVLGLALQDTLGNLFAGVALQMDKPYEIGDWIEVQASGNQKWIGQVYEITWRATVLIGFTEENITIPNRVMGQALVANFSTKYRPIIRSQVFRLPFGVNIAEVRDLLTYSAKNVPEIRKSPSPLVLVSETTESWVGFKLVYFIEDYGAQFVIADRVFSQALTDLKASGYELAGHRIVINPHLNEEMPPSASSP